MNEKNEEKKNHSRFDADNFSCHKRSPADKITVSSIHLGVDDEDSSIRTDGVIHSRLDGAALDQELTRLPLVRFFQVQSLYLYISFASFFLPSCRFMHHR
jgi:hypothetical protein